MIFFSRLARCVPFAPPADLTPLHWQAVVTRSQVVRRLSGGVRAEKWSEGERASCPALQGLVKAGGPCSLSRVFSCISGADPGSWSGGPSRVLTPMEGGLSLKFAQNTGFFLKIPWKLHDFEEILGAMPPGSASAFIYNIFSQVWTHLTNLVVLPLVLCVWSRSLLLHLVWNFLLPDKKTASVNGASALILLGLRWPDF